MTTFRAGAASIPLEPPLDLPMVGFVRQRTGSQGYGIPLETTRHRPRARLHVRVVLCGVDIVGITSPQVEALIERVAAATGRRPGGRAAQLEPHAPRSDQAARSTARSSATSPTRHGGRSTPSRRHPGQDRVRLQARRRAARARPRGVGAGGGRPRGQPTRARRGGLDPRLEPGRARRQPAHGAPGPTARRVGHRDARRLRLPSSHDRPRPLRLLGGLPRPDAADGAERSTGGECVYFQGAGGNVLPRFSFNTNEDEARRMGTSPRRGRRSVGRRRLRDARSRSRCIRTAPRTSTRCTGRVRSTVRSRSSRAAMETVTIPLMPLPGARRGERASGGATRPRSRRRARAGTTGG